MGLQCLKHDFFHARFKMLVAFFSRVMVPDAEFDVSLQHVVQLAGKAPQLRDSAVMSEIDLAGFHGHDAVYRSVRRIGLELHRRAGGEDEFAPCNVEFPVGNPERVAAENRPAALVPDAEVVARMAGRIEKCQRAAIEIEFKVIWRFEHALRGDRNNLSISLSDRGFAIDRRGPCHQFCRVDHVACAARVNHQPGIRELLQHQPCRPGVIQMDMGDDDIGHILWREPIGA